MAFVLICFLFIFKSNTLGRGSEYFLKNMSKNKNKSYQFVRFIFAVAEAWLLWFAQIKLGEFNRVFGDLIGTGANYFGTLFISPIMVSLFALLFGRDVFRLMDLVTIVYPFKLIFVKLACFCGGCCRGFACSFGLYNYSSEQTEFPVQLVEMALAAVIFVFLLFYRKKAKEGTMFPIYIIIYSATRFFSEFLRCEENVFFILKKYHILCLIGIAVGFFLLFAVEKYKEKIRRFYYDYFDAVEDTFDDIAVRMGIKRKREIVHSKKKKNTKHVPVQSAAKKQRISDMKKWIIIWTLGLIGQIGWNVESSWFNTFVYEKIDKNPSIITPMLIMSAFATTVSMIFFGTLTDRTGKRRTLVSTGFFIWGILIVCFGLAQYIVKSNFILAIVYMVIMDMLLSFFGSMSTDIGYSTWLTDIMNDRNRGQIGGAIAIQAVLGSMLGNIIGGYIIGTENNYMRLFIVIGSFLSFFGMISIFLFDKKDDVKPFIEGSFLRQLLSVFDFKTLKKSKEFLWIHVAVALFFTGYNTYFPHLGNMLIDYLDYSATQMGIIMAVPLLFAMLVTVPVSKFINNNKYIEVSLVSIITGLIGNSFMFNILPEHIDTEKTFNLRIYSAIFLVGVSFIIMLQATKTWTKNLFPKNAKGKYEGLWAIAFAFIPMHSGSLIGEWVIKNNGVSFINTVTERYEYIPDGKIFLVGAIISTLSIIPIIITKKYINKNESSLKTESIK
ncbi:MAG: MFS transporter [Clostridia bacterium]|nr:MFS transporter [Clostridia bacterium]